MNKVVPVVLFLSLILSLCASAEEISAAAPSTDAAEKLAQEFEMTKTSVMKDEIQQRKVLGSLFEINRKMKKLVNDKGQLEQEKLLVGSNVTELAGRIVDLEAKVKDQKSQLRQRLSAIYKLGGQGLARILLTSASSAELERNLKILGVVAKQDMDLIKNYDESMKELEARKRKLSLRYAHLKKLEDKIAKQETQLGKDNLAKNSLLEQVRQAQAKGFKKLGQIRKRSREIAAKDESGLLDNLFQPAFYEQKGLLPKPIQGQVTQGFGIIKDPQHQVILSHSGQFFTAAPGSEVKSVFSGKVAFSGEVPGFGKTLILDHGDHYFSVYAHNKDLKVATGDEIAQSQLVALSGSSDSEMGDGLYFEIRHFSEPSDPRLWMKGN